VSLLHFYISVHRHNIDHHTCNITGYLSDKQNICASIYLIYYRGVARHKTLPCEQIKFHFWTLLEGANMKNSFCPIYSTTTLQDIQIISKIKQHDTRLLSKQESAPLWREKYIHVIHGYFEWSNTLRCACERAMVGCEYDWDEYYELNRKKEEHRGYLC
jgi:hypothetical protein